MAKSTSEISQPERATQERVIALLRDELGYRFLGSRAHRGGNSNVEEPELAAFLKPRGHSDAQIAIAVHRLRTEADHHGRGLYGNNQSVYSLLRYGVPAKVDAGEAAETVHPIDWRHPERKEDEADDCRFKLDKYLLKLCRKDRFLELIHDFVLFDGGTKKLPRVHQYFGMRAAQEHVRRRLGGIIWHTQGSGKSLVMVLLARWILENLLTGGCTCGSGRARTRRREARWWGLGTDFSFGRLFPISSRNGNP